MFRQKFDDEQSASDFIPSPGSPAVDFSADLPLRPGHASALRCSMPVGPGVRRDCTRIFKTLRRSGRLGAHGDASEMSAEGRFVSDIFGDFSLIRNSLASKLAQHNGFRQFGAEFAGRVPPIEMRLMVNQLNEEIPLLLEELSKLIARLRSDSVAYPHQEIRCHLRSQIESTLCQNTECFDLQRKDLELQAVASPLTSPLMSPALCKRLVSAGVSTCGSSAGSPLIGPERAPASSSMSEIEPLWPTEADSDSDNDASNKATSSPFVGLFCEDVDKTESPGFIMSVSEASHRDA
jgi:hypothetical protein